MNIVVILAGSKGIRFGSKVNKNYLKLNGKEVIGYPIELFKSIDIIDKVLLVVDSQEYVKQYIQQKYNIETISGGSTRTDSVKNAIDYINLHYPNCENVMFHDGNRPLIRRHTIEDYFNEINNYDAVVTTSVVTDSLNSRQNKYIERDQFLLVQTPELFKFKLFKSLNWNYDILTIVNQFDIDNIKICNKKLDYFNFKITYPEDLFLAEQLVRINYIKENEFNFNINKLNNKKFLILGGSGGLGIELIDILKQNKNQYFAPTHNQLNLQNLSVEKIFESCKDFIPDVIINSAAVSISDKDGILENFDLVMDINLKSNLVIFEYAKQLHKNVNVICLSSSSSTKGRKNISNYSASKCALNSIVESLNENLHDNGVNVNVIIPEKMSTPMIQKLHNGSNNDREMLNPKNVAQIILDLSVSDNYGQLIHVRKGV